MKNDINRVLFCLLIVPSSLFAGLEVEDIGKQYDPSDHCVPAYLQNHTSSKKDVCRGNTSFRNESDALLVWKGNPNENGYGYFQRNRDLGQIVNIPDGQNIRMDAIVLRTSRGSNAFMVGAPQRGIALAISTKVHQQKAPEFIRDADGVAWWEIRREGCGILPPTMTEASSPTADAILRKKLIRESVFPENRWDHLMPTSNGCPDVDTYRSLQFYIEIHPNNEREKD